MDQIAVDGPGARAPELRDRLCRIRADLVLASLPRAVKPVRSARDGLPVQARVTRVERSSASTTACL